MLSSRLVGVDIPRMIAPRSPYHRSPFKLLGWRNVPAFAPRADNKQRMKGVRKAQAARISAITKQTRSKNAQRPVNKGITKKCVAKNEPDSNPIGAEHAGLVSKFRPCCDSPSCRSKVRPRRMPQCLRAGPPHSTFDNRQSTMRQEGLRSVIMCASGGVQG
jgi:hypothetical protein